MAKSKIKCPKCKSINVIPIVYGLPTPEAEEEAKKGLFKLGGCIVSEESPKWHCKNCGYEWK